MVEIIGSSSHMSGQMVVSVQLDIVSSDRGRVGRDMNGAGVVGGTSAQLSSEVFVGRLAQWESIGLTSRGSQVQALYRPPTGFCVSNTSGS